MTHLNTWLVDDRGGNTRSSIPPHGDYVHRPEDKRLCHSYISCNNTINNK